jgi:hypothetical protein
MTGRFAAASLLAAPGLVLGLGAAALAAALPPALEGGVWWLGFLLRAGVWGALGAAMLGDAAIERAAAGLGLSPARRCVIAFGGPARAPLVIAAAAGAAAAMREIDYFAGFGRAGGETLAVRAAQLLHFGFRPQVAGVALALSAWAVALGGAMAAALCGWKRAR